MRRLLPGLVAVSVAACSAVNPQIGQLETFKQQAAASNWAPIAQSSVSCAPASAGCAQLHQIKADACVAIAGTVPPTGQAPSYDCAIDQYDAALAARPDPAIDPARLWSGELESLQRRRDLSRSGAEAAPFNDRLLSTANRAIAAEPGQAVGYTYLASALLSRGLAEAPPQGCRTLDQAAAALGQAASRPGAPSSLLAQRQRDIANARVDSCRA